MDLEEEEEEEARIKSGQEREKGSYCPSKEGLKLLLAQEVEKMDDPHLRKKLMEMARQLTE